MSAYSAVVWIFEKEVLSCCSNVSLCLIVDSEDLCTKIGQTNLMVFIYRHMTSISYTQNVPFKTELKCS